MKHKLPAIYIICCLLVNLPASGQHAYDTVQVMSYNTLNYGFPATSNCPTLLTQNKHAWLKKIIQYANPDILGLEKMDASPATFTSDTVIHAVLDSVCAGCYAHTPYTNHSGYEKENTLYFKTDKFGWLSTTTIYSADTNISDINLHKLYYKPTQQPLTDTIFLNIILVHLKSGSGNAAERALEVTGAMNWLNAHLTAPGNYICMGDFNTQSSDESCFQQLIMSANPNTLFTEPTGQLGNWNGNPSSFANYLTQSTRTADPGDCGATGGQDDWFDHLLCSTPVIQGTKNISYVSNSFTVIGQDGQHVNKSLIASPPNNSVPSEILNALYYMSEHLPVTMQLAIDTGHAATAIATLETAINWHYNTLVSNQLTIEANGLPQNNKHNYYAGIYDLTGRLLLAQKISFTETVTLLNQLSQGMYLLVITHDNQPVLNGRFFKSGN